MGSNGELVMCGIGVSRYRQTLDAIESVALRRVVPAGAIHAWLRSWGGQN